MKFAHAEHAIEPRTQTIKIVAWVFAALLVIMAIGQLFSFEKFIPLISEYYLPGGEGMATLVASLIVITEIFALPFLLRMPLSPLMRWFSLFCGFAASFIWLLLGFVALTGDVTTSNSGLLGVKVAIPTGWPQLIWSVVMTGLASYAAWGLWPHSKK